MREIKFRAWDKNSKNIINNFAHIGTSGRMYTIHHIGNENEYEVMQYTGLKDKNGKEIYEGDLVGEEDVYHFLDRDGWEPSIGNWKIIGEKRKNFTGKKEERYVAGYELKTVVWKTCGFEPFCDSENNCGHCGGGIRSEDIEVIGNIYENPELLTNPL